MLWDGTERLGSSTCAALFIQMAGVCTTMLEPQSTLLGAQVLRADVRPAVRLLRG